MGTSTLSVPESGEVEVDPFHLVLDPQLDAPVTNVGVCVNESLIEWIRENEIRDPQLLITVFQGTRTISRHVIPLEEGFVHVTYPRPETFVVEACVIYNEDDERVGSVKSVLLRTKNNGQYTFDTHDPRYGAGGKEVLGDHRGLVIGQPYWREKHNVAVWFHDHAARREVVVADNNFAEEPAAWRQYWLSMFFRSWRDQCQTRKQTWFFAPLLTLFYLPLHYLAKLVGIVGALALGLVYQNGFKYAVRPGRHGSMGLVFGSIRGKRSFWFYKKDRTEASPAYDERSGWVVLGEFVALVILVVAGIIYAAGTELIRALVLAATWTVGPVAVLVTVVLAIRWLLRRNDSPEKKAERKRAREAREQTHLRELAEELGTMSCSTGQMSIGTLVDRRRRRPVVVFHRFKDAVCKPYAK